LFDLTIIISLNKENLQCLCDRIDQDGMVLFLNQFATMTKVKKVFVFLLAFGHTRCVTMGQISSHK